MATIDVSAFSGLQDALDSSTQDTYGDTFTFPDGYTETLTGIIDCTTYATTLTDSTKYIRFKALGSCELTVPSSGSLTSETSTGRYVSFDGIDFKGPTPGSYVGNGLSNGYYSYWYIYNCSFTDMATGVTSNQRTWLDSVKFDHCARCIRGLHIYWTNGLACNESEIFASGTQLYMDRCVVSEPRYNRWDADRLIANQCTFYRPTTGGTCFYQTGSRFRQISDCVFKNFSSLVADSHGNMFTRCSAYNLTTPGHNGPPDPIIWDVEDLASDPLPNAPTNFVPADVGLVLSNNQPDFNGVMPTFSFRGAVPGAGGGGGGPVGFPLGRLVS